MPWYAYIGVGLILGAIVPWRENNGQWGIVAFFGLVLAVFATEWWQRRKS